MTTISSTSGSPTLEAMVADVLAAGYAQRLEVAQAMRVVPRHRFIPEATAAQAHGANLTYVTKRGPDGRTLSCASAPTIVAMMLDMLDVRPGHRVLEIGAGTGYNAALLAHLVGEGGQVVTVDNDSDATVRTRTALAVHGGGRVEVLHGDGVLGAPGHGVFDRIIVTAGAWDVPPAWTTQLAPGGRLVVPLRWRGQTRAIGFTHDPDGVLRSDTVELCAFVPLPGPEGQRRHHLDTEKNSTENSTGNVTGNVWTLSFDQDQPITPELLVGLLDQQPTAQVWSGVTVEREQPFDGVWLRLAVTEPTAAWLVTDLAALIAAARPRLFDPLRTACVAGDDSLALFCFRRVAARSGPAEAPGAADGDAAELGALGFGPAGADLASAVLAAIHTWDTDRTLLPRFTLHPTDTPDNELPPGTVITKQHRRLLIAYPTR